MQLVIPYHPKDAPILPHCLASCRRFLPGLDQIYLVSRARPPREAGHDVHFIHEDEFFPGGPTRRDLYRAWRSRAPSMAWRAGWLYQQWIKLGAARVLFRDQPCYLTIDADVVLLRPLAFQQENRYLFTRVPRDYPADFPYYRTYERLLGEAPLREPGSIFIANHMIFDCALVDAMLAQIERVWARPWTEAILEAMDPHMISAFSEFETYVLWLRRHHPDRVAVRDLRCLQKLRQLPASLEAYADTFDLLTLHAHLRERGTWKSRIKRLLRTAGLLRE